MDASSINVAVLNAIGWVLISGFILSIVLLVMLHRRFPVSQHHATEVLRERSWSGGETLLLLGTFMGFSLLIPLLPRMIPGRDDMPGLPLFAMVVFAFSQITVLLLISRHRQQPWAADFGMGRRKIVMLVLSLLIYLASVPVLGMASFVYQRLLVELFGMEVDIQSIARLITESTSWIKAGYVLLAVAGAPLYEELIFRGVLFPFLVRRIGLLRALLLVSAVFAVLHFHIPTLVPLFLLSVILCLAYWRTASLWTCIGIHAMFNGMTILVLAFQP